MSRHTVHHLAKLSGVSVRTLHYYDEIGLLKPVHIGANGYRYYEREQLLRLQQILFFRELDFSLADIAAALDAPDFDRAATLRAHRKTLEAHQERYARLLRTLDRTLAELDPRDEALFDGFSPDKQERYEAELIERGGERMAREIERSRATMSRWSARDMARMRDEMADIEASLATALRARQAHDAEDVQRLIARHFAWVSQFWTPNRESYAGLGALYTDHPDFVARYERRAPGLAAYLRAAMETFAATALAPG